MDKLVKIVFNWERHLSFPHRDVVDRVLNSHNKQISALFEKLLVYRDCSVYRVKGWALAQLPIVKTEYRVISFPNILIYFAKSTDGVVVLDPFPLVLAYNEDMKKKNSVKYKDPLSYYGKQTDIKLVTWLAVAWMNTVETTDDKRRDFAFAMTCDTPDIEVHWAKTPQDYFNMYKITTAGCCGVGRNSYATKIRTQLGKEGFWPSMWHHYQPNSQGLFLMDKGEITARWFLLRDISKSEKWTHYSGYRTINASKYGKLVAAWCAHSGLTKRAVRFPTADMEIPAIKWKDNTGPKAERHWKGQYWVCPMPYTDDFNPGDEHNIYMFHSQRLCFFITHDLKKAQKAQKIGFEYLFSNASHTSGKYLYDQGNYVTSDGEHPYPRI